MLFLGLASRPEAHGALQLVEDHQHRFDDRQVCFYGVTVDPADAHGGRVRRAGPGVRWLLDFDRSVSSLFGACTQDRDDTRYRPHWLLLDPLLRVRRVAVLSQGSAIFSELAQLTQPAPAPTPLPVLQVPDVLPADFCEELIAFYEREGGTDIGFVRDEAGASALHRDRAHKVRSDCLVRDDGMLARLRTCMIDTIAPMVQRAFQFRTVSIERWNIACYDAQEGGHFRAHRDNTAIATAHRRFACTINLNAGAYEGGELCFPEFGQALHAPPTGAALIFSCSLLHEVRPVTRGKRYALVPFLCDESA